MLAPIVIFGYKRPNSLKRTVESLLDCTYADQSEVFVFCDGAKNERDLKAVKAVKTYLEKISGFKKINLFFSEKNKGLANSIIDGISKVHELYDSVIVLEDDLLLSKNFLVYMNAALNFYKDDQRIFSISGYNVPMMTDWDYKYDVYFTPRGSSWGWASWKNRWELVDWDVSDYHEFKNSFSQIRAFNKGGGDLSNMLRKKMRGKIDSWAIRWCYAEFRNGLFSVYPTKSKVQNIGFDATATNSNVYNRYHIELDDGIQTAFSFTREIGIDNKYYKQFVKFYGFFYRLSGRMRTFFHKIGFLSNK